MVLCRRIWKCWCFYFFSSRKKSHSTNSEIMCDQMAKSQDWSRKTRNRTLIWLKFADSFFLRTKSHDASLKSAFYGECFQKNFREFLSNGRSPMALSCKRKWTGHTPKPVDFVLKNSCRGILRLFWTSKKRKISVDIPTTSSLTSLSWWHSNDIAPSNMSYKW